MIIANDDDVFKRLALDQFISEGLGFLLKSNANLEIVAGGPSSYDMILCLGGIIERICWVQFGQWLGSFDASQPAISEEERAFISRNVRGVQQKRWPAGDLWLPYLEGLSPTYQVLADSPERRLLRPIFQAACIVCEGLTGGCVKSLFRFLEIGDLDAFREYKVTAEMVMGSLESDSFVPESFLLIFSDASHVIAGFIKLIICLSSLENLFSEEGVEIKRKLDRSFVRAHISEFIKWRVAIDGQASLALEAVSSAFDRLAREVFEEDPCCSWAGFSGNHVSSLTEKYLGLASSETSLSPSSRARVPAEGLVGADEGTVALQDFENAKDPPEGE